MARRQLGVAAVRSLAASPDLAQAVAVLGQSPYGRHLQPAASLAEAQRAVAAAVLWNLRVLAGWLPAGGMPLLRLLAGWFEVANVDEHLQALAGEPAEPPFRLGALATAWPALAATMSPGDLRTTLARTPWGDPGGADPRSLTLGMRAAWAERVAAGVPRAEAWAAGAVALLLARELFVTGQPLPEAVRRAATRTIGGDWTRSATLPQLAQRVGPSARWALRGTAEPSDLWSAELRWWRRLRADGVSLLRSSRYGDAAVLGTVAVMAADAWQVRAALELAARGGGHREVLDALA